MGTNYLTHWADIFTIIIYFTLVMGVGIWSICRPTRQSVRGYFLAGRSMVWWPIALSLFASNIGSEHFIGLAGTGSASGIAVIMFEWNAGLCLLALGWLFVPVYVASGIYTMPEYLARRFGGSRLRTYQSIVALITYIFVNISVDLYSGGLFFSQATGLSIYVGIVILLGVTALYTVLGGLSTVIYTDAIQVVIMLIGSVVLTVLGFIRIGGYNQLEYKYMRAIPNSYYNNTNNTCGLPSDDAFHIFRGITTVDYPWLGTFIRSVLGSVYYWCANQVIVQRTLAAKHISHTKAGTVVAAYLKILPLFIMVMPGMISRILFPSTVGCATPDECMAACQNPAGCSNIAYPKLVLELLPAGLRGLLLAVMMAALVSSLTSILNSASTIFTMDLWRKLRPKSSETELLLVGKAFVAIMCVVGIVWIPMMQSAEGGQIFRYARAIAGYFGSPAAIMFLLAMFWGRINEPGAFWGMVISQILGISRFVLDFVYPAPRCGVPDTRPGFVSQIHPYYFSAIQMAVAAVLATVISFLTPAIPREKLSGLMFWTRYEKPHYLREEDTPLSAKYNTAAIDKMLIDEKPLDQLQPSIKVTPTKPWRRWFNVICGISEEKPTEEDEQEDYISRMTSLVETRKMQLLLTSQASVMVAILIFLYIFYR